MKSFFNDSNGFREDLKILRTPINNKRTDLKESIIRVKDSEKALKEIISSNYRFQPSCPTVQRHKRLKPEKNEQ